MTAKNFNEAIASLTGINRVWALRNYQQPENKVGYLSNWLYNVLVLTLSVVSAIHFELFQLHQLPFGIERTLYLYQLFFYVLMTAWMVVVGWYYSRDALALRKCIAKVDENVKKLGIPINYQKMFVRVTTIGSLWLLCSILMAAFYTICLLQNFTWLFSLFATLAYVYETNVGSIVLFDYKTTVSWLGMRFKQTNELLDSILKKDHETKPDIDAIYKSLRDSHPRFQIDQRSFERFSARSKIFPEDHALESKPDEPRSVKTMLQEIRYVHLQLYCVSKTLNKMFDTQLMIYISVTLVYITIVLYYTYVEIYISTGTHKIGMNFMTMLILDGVSNFTKLCLVSYDCESTMKQAKKIAKIVHKCSLYQEDTELKEEILQFSLQISHAQLGTTNVACFRLNFSFLRECASLVSTYLIIIIQLNQNPDTNDVEITPNTTSY